MAQPLLRWTILLACLAVAAPRAGAESWSEVFAGERDTTVFLGADGTLFRAPFDLGTREILWRGTPDAHVVRFIVGPASGRIAWTTRGFDRDTTRLWVTGANGPELKLRYFALIPNSHGRMHTEAEVPSIADPDVRGGRLVQVGASMKQSAANTLDWTPDGREVVLGYDAGILRLEPMTHTGMALTGTVAFKLDALHPSPLLLADTETLPTEEERAPVTQYDLDHYFVGTVHTLVVQDGRRVTSSPSGTLILRPTPRGWNLYDGSAWSAARVRAAGATTLWWAHARVVYSLRAGDSVATEARRATEDVDWLGYDAAHHDLLMLSGRRMWRIPETGGEPALVFAIGGDARAVLRSKTGARIALSLRDSVLVWHPGLDEVRGFGSNHLEPCELYEGRRGQIVLQVECGPGLPRQLARADTIARRLVAIDTPNLREGVFQPAAGGDCVLLFDPGPKPPHTLHAYDVAHDRWRTVENPGISAWEPLR